jgi:toxin ParE1/3/4
VVEIVWTDKSIEDIDSIAEYIAQQSHHYATLQTIKFFSRVEQLINYPKSGKIVAEFGNNSIRELIEGNYRIVYRIVSKSQIHIIRIHHSSIPLKRRHIK